MIHSIRYVQFGLQIIEYGRISDFTVANTHFIEIMEETSEDCNFYNSKYGVLAKTLYKNVFLKAVLNDK